MESATLSMDAMRRERESLGDLFPERGYISPDQHREAVIALSQIKDQVLSKVAKSAHGFDA